MYHNVVPPDASAGHDLQGITLREGDFIRQIGHLRRFFTFVDFETYSKIWRDSGSQPLRHAVISFDDGTWPTYEYGVKYLISQRIPSIVFVNSCQIDNGPLIWGSYLNALCYDSGFKEVEIEGRIFLLTGEGEQHASKYALFNIANKSSDPQGIVEGWASRYPIGDSILKYYRGFSSRQLREAGASAYVEVGAHTHTHPFLSKLTRFRQRDELLVNRSILEEKVGKKIRYVAYPSGDYNVETLSAVEELGFDYGFSVHQKYQVLIPKYELPRLGIYSSSSLRVLASVVKYLFNSKKLRFEK